MNLPVVLRAEAQAEFDQAFDWYESKRLGLGLEFLALVQDSFDRIVANPFQHQIVLGDIRKAAMRRFPYCIFYRAHPERIEVIAVFHTSRDPSEWQRRS